MSYYDIKSVIKYHIEQIMTDYIVYIDGNVLKWYHIDRFRSKGGERW